MIKKILTLTFLLTANLILVGQSCTPDVNITVPGYYPAQLDSAQEMQMYSMTVQIHSTRDTMVDNPFGPGQVAATIDSLIVDSVAGIPAGINFICNPSNCRFVSLKTHCINLFGTPPQGSAGTYPLVIYIRAKATVGGGFKTSVTEEIRDFQIVVKDDNISSYTQIKATEALKIYPNPSLNQLHIENLRDANGTVQIYTADGKEVGSYNLLSKQQLQIDNSRWNSGIYTVKLNYADGFVSQMQINKL